MWWWLLKFECYKFACVCFFLFPACALFCFVIVMSSPAQSSPVCYTFGEYLCINWKIELKELWVHYYNIYIYIEVPSVLLFASSWLLLLSSSSLFCRWLFRFVFCMFWRFFVESAYYSLALALAQRWSQFGPLYYARPPKQLEAIYKKAVLLDHHYCGSIS